MIYFIQQGTSGPIKIGSSRHPIKRLKILQTATPYELHLLGMMMGGRVKEGIVQSMFSDYMIRNEWFRPTKELLRFIKAHTSLESILFHNHPDEKRLRRGHDPKRGEEILRFLKSFIEKNGYPPTVREIGQGVGISHPSVVKYHLDSLILEGTLRRTNSKCRNIELV